MTKDNDFNKAGLLNKSVITSYILKDAPWADSHGADPGKEYLGAGLLYYTIAYVLRAKLCVCIGSGGGFVPRLMRQAQMDLGISDARTVLIDANAGKWNRPKWIDEKSFFRTFYGDIEIIIDESSNIFKRGEINNWRIDYLHIDGDHSHKGSLNDFKNYIRLMSPRGIITFHDTKPHFYYNITCWKTLCDVRDSNHRIIDFPWIGNGTAIIQMSNYLEHSSVLDMSYRQRIFGFISMIKRRIKAKIKLLHQKIIYKADKIT
jgi:hypothetical protein